LKKHKDFLKDKEKEPEKIPCIIMESFNFGKTRQYRICICVEMLVDHQENILKDSIKCISHKNLYAPFNCILGIPYKEVIETPVCQNDTRKKSQQKNTHVYWQIFDTIRLKKKEGKVHPVYNFYNTNEWIDLSLHARVEENIKIDDIEKRSGHMMNIDIDQFYIINYHHNNGLANNKLSKIVHPIHTKKLVWDIRNEDDDYKKLKRAVINDYPKQWIDTIKEDIENRKKIDEAGKRGDDTVYPITDLFSRDSVFKMDNMNDEDISESFADMQFEDQYNVKEHYHTFFNNDDLDCQSFLKKRKRDPNMMLVE
jgi:hypothetical protein